MFHQSKWLHVSICHDLCTETFPWVAIAKSILLVYDSATVALLTRQRRAPLTTEC